MEFFFSDGGNNRPFFIYRLKIDDTSTEIYEWCKNYPSKGPFSRWHIDRKMISDSKTNTVTKFDIVIQFELKDAYLAFMYAFAGHILKDLTWKEYR